MRETGKDNKNILLNIVSKSKKLKWVSWVRRCIKNGDNKISFGAIIELFQRHEAVSDIANGHVHIWIRVDKECEILSRTMNVSFHFSYSRVKRVVAKNSWQNLLEAESYMEISKNSCSHVYCCNVYALNTCFITSAHWAVQVQSLILARNVHFMLTAFEKENFVNNDRSSPLRKSICGNIWEGNYTSQSVCFYTNSSGESSWSVGCQFLLGPECFSNKQVTTE